ncbi:unnamed protein product [Hymenolepis diminuta]|uniref:Uncharacterized protein n=1 Tax=Hymenolepis diminuta TaxID=6216 RepID=A0A0R3SRX4_HYMDI|nr:unnamed protein product [Hymenolepis diminuta]VUZ47582.1 unnamed protein product [Hymenolepis diminuta]
MDSDDVFMLELTVDPYENEFLFEYLQFKYKEARDNYKKSSWDSNCLEVYMQALCEFKEYLEGKKRHIKSKFKEVSLRKLPQEEKSSNKHGKDIHHGNLLNPSSSREQKEKNYYNAPDYIYVQLPSPPAKRIRKSKSFCISKNGNVLDGSK